MNALGLTCNVKKGLGRATVAIITEDDKAYYHIFQSPSVYSFKNNSAEILNWHRDNIISLISQFNIQLIAVKKTERTSFVSKPKNSDIFKLYLEGVFLSFAGSIGLKNHHYYKKDVQHILSNENIFETTISDICRDSKILNTLGHISKSDEEIVKEALLVAISIKSKIGK